MSIADSESPRFDTRTGQVIRRCLRVCRYHDDLIEEDYTLGSNRNVPFVAFAHRPHDARSSCIAFLPESRTPREDVAGRHELGVPLAFFAGVNSWEMWSLRSDHISHELTPAKNASGTPSSCRPATSSRGVRDSGRNAMHDDRASCGRWAKATNGTLRLEPRV